MASQGVSLVGQMQQYSQMSQARTMAFNAAYVQPGVVFIQPQPVVMMNPMMMQQQ